MQGQEQHGEPQLNFARSSWWFDQARGTGYVQPPRGKWQFRVPCKIATLLAFPKYPLRALWSQEGDQKAGVDNGTVRESRGPCFGSDGLGTYRGQGGCKREAGTRHQDIWI